MMLSLRLQTINNAVFTVKRICAALATTSFSQLCRTERPPLQLIGEATSVNGLIR